MLEYEDLTGAVIGAAIEVHKALGPGLLEDIYENALCVELKHRALPFQRQMPLRIFYRQSPIGLYRLDLLVDDTIVVELKAISRLADIHFVTVRTYLHAADKEHALILNFGKPKLETKRVQARRFQPQAGRPRAG
jgi:GxxExxY protein